MSEIGCRYLTASAARTALDLSDVDGTGGLL